MTTTVRVAIQDDLPPIEWPRCCPKCGATDSLVSATSRLGRVKSIRPNLLGGMTMKSDVLHLSFPVCEKHAQETRWANLILDNGPLARLIHMIVYMGALFALPMLIRPVNFVSQFGLFALYPVLSVLGVVAIVWARRTSSLRPTQFDPDMDVFEVQFSDEDYATKFRVQNRKATSSSLTEAPPWYMRSLLWKIVIIVVFLGFIAKLMKH